VISGRTALYGVMGHPVAHSLSPAMQNAAFAEVGIDAVYLALPVAPDALSEAIRGAHALGFQGLNVTVPHKEKAAAWCVRLDGVAREVGAVNTLKRAPDGYQGTNTDAPACRDLLAALGVGPGTKALLLGAGGAARAAGWALLALGASVRVAARRPEAAVALCRDLSRLGRHGHPEPAPWAEVAVEAGRAAVVVNGTSAGLHAKAEGLPALTWSKGQVAVDFVYGDTAFMGAARAAGARLVTGEQILLRQGALAFTHWTGRPAPEAAMARAIAGRRDH
jgi:shikimate dehydrogenase